MIRKRIADIIDGVENYFCIDSKPMEVCRVSRGKRCKMGHKNYSASPSFGYCASQGVYYYGYKLHSLCGLSGVIHSYDLTQAGVHDVIMTIHHFIVENVRTARRFLKKIGRASCRERV